MKIRPKTFKLLKELLLEKGGVFYDNGIVINFKYQGNEFYDYVTGYGIIDSDDNMKVWLGCDDWYIKV